MKARLLPTVPSTAALLLLPLSVLLQGCVSYREDPTDLASVAIETVPTIT